jgi:peptidoglycan/LPS O-acetylase OafA/YrhL
MRLRALDGLRGLVALIVVLYHMQIVNSVYHADWLRNAQPLLDVFFILSGFVIAMTYGDRLPDGRSLAEFMIRRVGRAWPLHVLILVGFVGLETVRLVLWDRGLLHAGLRPFEYMRSWPQFFENLLLIQSWGWGAHKPFTWNYPSWTVSTEVTAYFVMGLMTIFVKSPRMRIVAASALMLLSGLAYFHQSNGFDGQGYVSVSRCMMGFFLGYLLFFVWNRWPIRSRFVGSVLEVVAVAGAIYVISAHVTGLRYLLSPLVFALVVYVFACEKGLVSRLLQTCYLPWIGEISYSIYISHALVLETLTLVTLGAQKVLHVSLFDPHGQPIGNMDPMISFGGEFMMDMLTFVVMTVIIGLGALLYHYVETPSRIQSGALVKRLFHGQGQGRGRGRGRGPGQASVA